MGTETIPDRKSGQVPQKSWINNFRDVLIGHLVGRAGSGIPQTEYARLGTNDYKWKSLHVYLGYLGVGDIFYFNDFGGAIPIPQGWFLCNGLVINQANYDAHHSAGDWVKYASATQLNGLYSPDLNDCYLTGNAAQTTTGAAPFSSSGSNTQNLSHSHGPVQSNDHASTNFQRPAAGATTFVWDPAVPHNHFLTTNTDDVQTVTIEPENFSVKIIMRIV